MLILSIFSYNPLFHTLKPFRLCQLLKLFQAFLRRKKNPSKFKKITCLRQYSYSTPNFSFTCAQFYANPHKNLHASVSQSAHLLNSIHDHIKLFSYPPLFWLSFLFTSNDHFLSYALFHIRHSIQFIIFFFLRFA